MVFYYIFDLNSVETLKQIHKNKRESLSLFVLTKYIFHRETLGTLQLIEITFSSDTSLSL